jgi:hypothetical protein
MKKTLTRARGLVVFILGAFDYAPTRSSISLGLSVFAQSNPRSTPPRTTLKAKNDTAMLNEVLAKIAFHNLAYRIHAMEELGIAADFGLGEPAPLAMSR